LVISVALACTRAAPASDEPAAIEAEQAAPPVLAPEREPEAADPEQTRNSGAALVAAAERITHLELSDGEQTILRFDDAVRDELVASLREEQDNGLSATSPPWPGYWVLVHVEGRAEPFVASIVAGGALRLNARDPLALEIATPEGAPDFENISDVGYSELLFDAAAMKLGPPESKEYRLPPDAPRFP
jgi:hypothetical protein